MLSLLSKTLTICKVRGIPIRLNISLVLLYPLFLNPKLSLLQSTIYFVLLLATIVMHELAHALTAKKYGIETQDIILFFFGGVARIKSLRKISNKEEFLITLAGPLSNLILALILIPIIVLIPSDRMSADSSLVYLCFVNIFLGIFNLIPAFPMDGGRLLRSTLSALGFKYANQITHRVSQVCAVLLFSAGIYFGLIGMVIISIFVLVSAPQELRFNPEK